MQRKPTELRPAEYNPRKMTPAEKQHLTDSVRRFGLVDPLVVNAHPERKDVVVGGHQRLKIATELGLETVPVVYVNLDQEREQELNLRLNKNLGDWDWQLLKLLNQQLLLDVGFTDQELQVGLDLFKPEHDEGRLDVITTPGTYGKTPITCPECGHVFTP